MSLSWAPPTDLGLGEGVPYPLLGYEVAVRSYPQDPQDPLGGGAEAVASFRVDGAATSASVPPPGILERQVRRNSRTSGKKEF